MKTIIQITLIFAATLMLSCKSYQNVQLNNIDVTKEDFIKVDASDYPDAKAVMISEELDFRREGVPLSVWQSTKNESSEVWQTNIVDKVLFLSDDVDDSSSLYYYYPRLTSQNLLTKCDMWLYSVDDVGKMTNRQLDKDEIDIRRVDDSTGIVQIKVNEPLKGKILFRKYTILSPYYPQLEARRDYPSYKFGYNLILRPIIFQKQIPLLFGRYQLTFQNWILERKAVKQLGEGALDVSYFKAKEFMLSYSSGGSFHHRRYGTPSGFAYDADKVEITVSNLKALSPNSDEEPAGIEFVDILHELIENEK